MRTSVWGTRLLQSRHSGRCYVALPRTGSGSCSAAFFGIRSSPLVFVPPHASIASNVIWLQHCATNLIGGFPAIGRNKRRQPRLRRFCGWARSRIRHLGSEGCRAHPAGSDPHLVSTQSRGTCTTQSGGTGREGQAISRAERELAENPRGVSAEPRALGTEGRRARTEGRATRRNTSRVECGR
jgi:hypothetical protein